ncbi:class I SAM-dependent methyltransferase [Desulfovibrio inopinatus]|uniref:class I SAM-dependent methyltransferase n=1 Tax=Desulfovibrio inopinatus TaxID=102109 RepID=UPI000423027F|nr:SAM-dependent methyltransferase [Desulfovibrio inopinatus]
MRKNNFSITAYHTALMRAAHQLLDTPKIFDDPLALRIIGSQAASDIRVQRKYKLRMEKYIRALVVARSEFVEHELAQAIQRGCRQYVLLGAGLDTFAYRNPYAVDGLQVYELDHPATQKWKRQRLKEANITLPESVSFIPAEFDHQSLPSLLKEAGVKTNEPTFYSCLGVSMYLTKEMMMSMMNDLFACSAPGSVIVFDYMIPPPWRNILRSMVFLLLSLGVRRLGEPWRGFFRPSTLKNDLQAIGFTNVEGYSPEDINAMYFSNRTDGLRAGQFGYLMKVVV